MRTLATAEHRSQDKISAPYPDPEAVRMKLDEAAKVYARFGHMMVEGFRAASVAESKGCQGSG